ncbi:MAG: L-ribulose-5-phosphate 4-epimerase [Halanaerobiales bacterium]
MLENLKEKVLEANLELKHKELIIYTWGNVSGIDRESGLVVIKPSGVAYDQLTADKMVVVNLEGNVVEGELKPSSDTATHLVLYKEFEDIGGIVHTHSPMATAWAQSGRGIPCYGTTHADYFYQEIPVTRIMTAEEVDNAYEENTGRVIVERFKQKNYKYTPAVLVAGHGPFTWGNDPADAVHNSVVLEEVAKMALNTVQLNNDKDGIPDYLMNKHFYRKHGKNAYYGQG